MTSPSQKLSDDIRSDAALLTALKGRREDLIALRMYIREELCSLEPRTPEYEVAMQKWALYDADYDSTVDYIRDTEKKLKRNRALLEDGVHNPRGF